jgi:hypothetical protein
MNLTNRRRFIYSLIGLSLFASLLLTLIFREQIRTGLVTPVSYAAWYINVILTTVPQPIFWAVLVFGGLYIAGRSLLKNLPTPDDPPEIPYSGHSVSRFQYWNWYLSSFQISQFSSEHMSRNLARFLLEILAFQEHQTIDQVEERQKIADAEIEIRLSAQSNGQPRPQENGACPRQRDEQRRARQHGRGGREFVEPVQYDSVVDEFDQLSPRRQSAIQRTSGSATHTCIDVGLV